MCGRTARTVRRAGTAKAVSDPYRTFTSPKARDSTDSRASMIAADDYAAAFKPRIFAGLSQLTVLISSLLKPNASI